MNTTTADLLRDDYLSRLDAAMRNVPHGVAAEIRGGILEELQGLDAAATAARIAQLGDPESVASEAQAGPAPAPPFTAPAPPFTAPAPTFTAPAPIPARRGPATGTRGFAIAAALTLSFGGIVLPFAGWVVGAVLVCFSPLWRTWEKLVAIIVPFVALLLVAAVVFPFQTVPGSAQGSGSSAQGSGSGSQGAQEVVNNPLLPVTLDLVWTGLIVLGLLLVPASGLWLLTRLRRR